MIGQNKQISVKNRVIIPLGRKRYFMRKYSRLSIVPIEVAPACGMLNSSVVKNSMIQSVGQEKGAEYDFTFENNGLQTFNNEWESGSF